MATIGIVHGAGDGGWGWHLVEEELRARGHRTVAPDLPADDHTATLTDYADVMVEEIGAREPRPLVIVGQSYGGFTAPLVAERMSADQIILVTAMIPRPGERPDDWWEAVGYSAAVREAADHDGGLTGHDDPFVSFLHDVPRPLAEEAMRRERNHPSPAAGAAPWPLDAWPAIPTRFILCTEDRFFPAALMRRLVAERLPGVTPEEIAAGHGVALSRPRELADLMERDLP